MALWGRFSPNVKHSIKLGLEDITTSILTCHHQCISLFHLGPQAVQNLQMPRISRGSWAQVELTHYRMAPVDPCCPQNRRSHDYLHAHKGSRRMSHPLIQDSSVSVLFPRYKGNLLTKINRSKLSRYSLFYKEMQKLNLLNILST